MKKNRLNFLFIIILILLNGCSKEQTDLSALAKEPPHSTQSYKFKTTDSHIVSTIKIPYSLIQSAIQKGLQDFETVPLKGTIDCSVDKEVKLGPIKKTVRIPCSSSYEGLLHIKQTGNVQVTRFTNEGSTQQKLKVTAPVKIFGEVGLRGKTAKKLGLSNKNVDASITVTVILDLGLQKNWAAYVNADVQHTWNTPPRIEIIRGKYITFTKQADKYIAKKLKEMPQYINSALTSLKLKDKVAKAWKAYAIPLDKLPINEPVNVVIIPKHAVFSDIHYTAQFVEFAVGIKITTAVHLGSKIKLPELGQPKLTKIKAGQPVFKLVLPVYVNYKLIKEQLNKALTGKSFKQKTDVGDINIHVKEVYIYPSNNKIVIGVKFKADVNGKLLKTTGKLFLVSKPTLNKSGTRLSLTRVSFSREFNNALLNAITYVFKTRINKLIEEKAQFDLSDTIKQTLTMLKKELYSQQKNSQFKIHLNQLKLRVSQLVVGAQQLILEAKLTGLVNLQLQNTH